MNKVPEPSIWIPLLSGLRLVPHRISGSTTWVWPTCYVYFMRRDDVTALFFLQKCLLFACSLTAVCSSIWRLDIITWERLLIWSTPNTYFSYFVFSYSAVRGSNRVNSDNPIFFWTHALGSLFLRKCCCQPSSVNVTMTSLYFRWVGTDAEVIRRKCNSHVFSQYQSTKTSHAFFKKPSWGL